MEFITFLHVLFVVVGFGGLVLSSVYISALKGKPANEALAIAEVNTKATGIAAICVILAGLFGFVRAGIEPKLFAQMWLSISMLLYFVSIAISFLLVGPAMRKHTETLKALVAGETSDADAAPVLESAAKKMSAFGGVNHLLFVVVLLLMVLQPF